MSYKSNLNPDVPGNSVYYSLSQNLYLAFLCLSSTMKRKDGYTTEDIVFEWIADKTEIDVGNKEMAQFDYKGSELTSGTDVFDTGQSRTMQGSIFFDNTEVKCRACANRPLFAFVLDISSLVIICFSLISLVSLCFMTLIFCIIYRKFLNFDSHVFI